MAACNFGGLSIKAPTLNYISSGPKLSTLQLKNGTSYQIPIKSKAPIRCKCLSKLEAITKSEDCSGESKPSSIRQAVPNSLEILRKIKESIFRYLLCINYENIMEALLTRICDTTSIAEFDLKLGGFRLYVARNLAGKTEQSSSFLPPPSQPSLPVNATTEATDQNGCASSPSFAITKSISPSGDIQSLFDTAADEGLMILQSPKVGFFRRSRTIKGKKAPPPCKEKQIVKEGQVLCYIEQLGSDVPIESDVAGEVIRILRKDGEPVGYGDALIAVLPSFPGIKKLQ